MYFSKNGYIAATDAFYEGRPLRKANGQHIGFWFLLQEGMQLVGMSAAAMAKELELLPSTIDKWVAAQVLPLENMQKLALTAIRKRISGRWPSLLTQKRVRVYDIEWTEIGYSTAVLNGEATTDRGYYEYQRRWLISRKHSNTDVECWNLFDGKNLVMESSAVSLLFACARELILEESAKSFVPSWT